MYDVKSSAPIKPVLEWSRLALLGFVRHVLSGEDDIKAVQLWHEADRDGYWLITSKDVQDVINKIFGTGRLSARLIQAVEALRTPVGYWSTFPLPPRFLSLGA